MHLSTFLQAVEPNRDMPWQVTTYIVPVNVDLYSSTTPVSGSSAIFPGAFDKPALLRCNLADGGDAGPYDDDGDDEDKRIVALSI